jgi:hypothetical protein
MMIQTVKVGKASLRRDSVQALWQSLRESSLFIWTIGMAVLLTLTSVTARAQIGVADVLGTVTDASGGVLADAKVTITNVGTSATRSTTTNDKGEYIFNLLPNGNYTIKCEAQGFKRSLISSFPLLVGDRARNDIKLEVGTVTENVEVTGEVANLQTDTSSVSNTIAEDAVQDLPFNNRNFITAIQIQPGIGTGNTGGASTPSTGGASTGTGNADRRPESTVVANGQTDGSNNQLVNGFDNNERSEGLIGVRPTVDGIDEMTVTTVNPAAEFGRASGAVVNITTKTGTNQLHGSAYDYFRNDIFDSENVFATAGGKPEYRQNNFGGSIGGPILKNKTFFFFAIEEERVVKGQTYISYVPTDQQRETPGDFTDMPNPVNMLTGEGVTDLTTGGMVVGQPVAINPIMLKFFNMYPKSNTTSNKKGIGEYISSPKYTQFGRDWEIRIDHHFTPNNQFFARYANNPVSTFVPGSLPLTTLGTKTFYPGGQGSWPGPSTTASQNMQLDYLHIFNPNLLLDLKAGYTRINIASKALTSGMGMQALLGMPNAATPGDPIYDIMPQMGGPIFDWSTLGSTASPNYDINNSFQYAGSVTYTNGSHSFKFGASLIRRQASLISPESSAGFFLYGATPPYLDSEVNFLAGTPLFIMLGGPTDRPGFRSWEPNGYAQDDWRVSHKLTLNLGVRYDVFTNFTEVQGRQTNFNPATISAGIGANNFIQGGTGGVKTDFKDIAPRIGFAYSITPTTVLRSSFGMSYFPGEKSATNGNPPYSFYNQTFTFPIGSSLVTINDFPKPVSSNLATYNNNSGITGVDGTALNLISPRALQSNLSLQREFGKNTVTLSYVGINSLDQPREYNLQQPDQPGALQPTPSYIYPQFTYINNMQETYSNGVSNYSAMQVVYTRRFSEGLSISANYTWAHALSDTVNSSSGESTVNDHPGYDYGNSYNDVRHRFAANWSYALPFGKSSHGVLAAVVKGWQLNGIEVWQSGIPFTIISSASCSTAIDPRCANAQGQMYTNIPATSTYRPNVTGKVINSNYSRSNFINLDAFTPQVPGTLGDEGYNQYSGPHFRNADLSVFRTIPIYERFKLQFRAECFNISNTPNYAFEEPTISSWTSNNGTLQPTDDGKVGVLDDTPPNANPRQFQFALKLLF